MHALPTQPSQRLSHRAQLGNLTHANGGRHQPTKHGHNVISKIMARKRAHEARERAGTKQQVVNMVDDVKQMPMGVPTRRC